MNKKIYIIIIFLLISFLIYNCTQNEIVEPENNSNYSLNDKMPPIPEAKGPAPIDVLISESVPVDTSDLPLSGDIYIKYTIVDSTAGTTDTLRAPVKKDTLKVYLRQVRFWKNLASRLIGPGTSYSLTYSSTVGTETYQAWEFTATLGYEISWKSGVSAGIFSSEVNQKLSFQFSSTFKTSKTFTTQETVTETQQVEAKEGVNRVYTVWQLMDGYDLVDEHGNVLKAEDLKKYIHLGTGKTIDQVLTLPTLIQGTTSIAQSTFDFPI